VPDAAVEQTAAREYAIAHDQSDMITLAGGARMHTLPPEERPSARVVESADPRWTPVSAALPVSAVRASSVAGRSKGPSSTIDRDLRTRWSPAGEGWQWLVYDLGAVQRISAVSIVWHKVKGDGTLFGIELSRDGEHYEDVDHGVLTGRGTKESLRSFLPQDARYVRVGFSADGAGAALAVQEVAVH